MTATQPADPNVTKPANVLALAPAYTDQTGATHVHKDYVRVVEPWQVEQHVAPIRLTEKLGDVESWADYINRFGIAESTLLTWSERGLRAVLDYPMQDGTPGRCDWIAEHHFERSHQWLRWERLASGQAHSQRYVLESLEDLAADIVEPDAATLLAVLRTLRTTANATAETELRADGSTHAVWTKNNSVKAGEIDLPSEFKITIPVLKGHNVTAEGGKLAPVLYSLGVRVRASVDDSAHLAIRLSMPNAERTLEAVFEDRVTAAESLLSEGHLLYRAADR